MNYKKMNVVELYSPQSLSELKSGIGAERFTKAALTAARWVIDNRARQLPFIEAMTHLQAESDDAFLYFMSSACDKALSEVE